MSDLPASASQVLELQVYAITSVLEIEPRALYSQGKCSFQLSYIPGVVIKLFTQAF